MTILHRYPVVGIGGLKTSGKDAFARDLLPFGFERRGMSDILDEMLMAINPWIRVDDDPAGENREFCTLIESDLPRFPIEPASTLFMSYQSIRKAFDYDDSKKILDVRRFLQQLGTEGGRNLIHPDVWSLRARRSAGKIAMANQVQGIPTVITGIRFPNELDMIKRLGGVTLWIDRPSVTRAHDEALAAADPASTHSSENSLSAEDFDHVILNDRDLTALKRKAAYFLDEYAQ